MSLGILSVDTVLNDTSTLIVGSSTQATEIRGTAIALPSLLTIGATAGYAAGAGNQKIYGSLFVRDTSAAATGAVFTRSVLVLGANVYNDNTGAQKAYESVNGASFLVVRSSGTSTDKALELFSGTAAQTADAAVASLSSIFSVDIDGNLFAGRPVTANAHGSRHFIRGTLNPGASGTSELDRRMVFNCNAALSSTPSLAALDRPLTGLTGALLQFLPRLSDTSDTVILQTSNAGDSNTTAKQILTANALGEFRLGPAGGFASLVQTLNGTVDTPVGIRFPSGGNTTLTHYEEASGSITTTLTGYTINTAYDDWHAVRVGDHVSLTFRLVFDWDGTVVSSAPDFTLTGLPSTMRPVNDIGFSFPTFNTPDSSFITSPGYFRSNGEIRIYRTASHGGFVSGTPGTYYTGNAAFDHYVAMSFNRNN